MAKTRKEKKELLQKYKDTLTQNPNYILVNMHGVGMTEVTQLKKQLRELDAQFFVVKNTLFKIAARETEQPNPLQEMENATGVIVCGEEVTKPAKILKDLQDEFETLNTKFGVLFGDITESQKVAALADIPSREVLLGKLAGSLISPLRSFISTARGNVRNFTQVLSKVKEAKAENN
jgi:large subunit ribosomal protein L10